MEDGEGSSVIIANTHAMTPSPPPTQTTPPIPQVPALSPAASPAPVPTSSNAAAEAAVFSTPNAQLSPSPPSTNLNNYNTKIPPVIVVPLSASLTSLNKQQQAFKSTTNSVLELVAPHPAKEQSPSRSIVPSITEEGWAKKRADLGVVVVLVFFSFPL